MEIAEAKQILGLNDNFTQMELISAYKKNIAENDPAAADKDELGTFSESANKLYDISRAYLLLRDKELEIVPELAAQPLIIFTDASVKKNIDVAAFGVVADNTPPNISLLHYSLMAYPTRKKSAPLSVPTLVVISIWLAGVSKMWVLPTLGLRLPVG